MACSTGGWREAEFVAGPISIADFAILGWAWRHERHKVDLADFPNVEALVRGDDGAPRHQARHRSETGLSYARHAPRRRGIQ